ncbi:FG-GAP repeat protein [Planctomycetes bacterium Poly30]|uniref:FG-GAP repeat protein n=1 Tax=Saltatorellus ferox TaxID=2528018 RepID=A0A518EW49_9BACT|nr:FG-GAP repeat protein [Planctomycetes bacterium Poly30]
MRISQLAPIACGGVLAAISSAQSEIYSILDQPTPTSVGFAMVALDDIDADGVADFAASAPGTQTVLQGGVASSGAIRAYSGASGALLWTAYQDPGDPEGSFGYHMSLMDDLNGDGIRDIAASRSGSFVEPDVTSRQLFFSGRDGAALGATAPLPGPSRTGASVSVTDVDGDGLLDLLVSEVPYGSTQALGLYSSATGSKLQSWQAGAPGENFGVFPVEIGDVDGLGLPDYLTTVRTSPGGPIALERISTETGGFLPRLPLLPADPHIIHALEPYIDLDGDGLDDLVLSYQEGLFSNQQSVLRAISSATGATLREYRFPRWIGQAPLAMVGDYDRDGVPDVAVGAPLFQSVPDPTVAANGGVFVISGRTWIPIGRYEGPHPRIQLGSALIAAGDLNGDGAGDLVATGLSNTLFGIFVPGQVVAIAAPLEVTYTYCSFAQPNATGATTRLEASGSTSVAANSLVIGARDVTPSVFGYLLVSSAPQLFPPAGQATQLCIQGPVGRLLQPGQVQQSDASGCFDVAIDLGNIPTPTGSYAAQPFSTLYFQAWHRDGVPLGSSFSNGLGVALIP